MGLLEAVADVASSVSKAFTPSGVGLIITQREPVYRSTEDHMLLRLVEGTRDLGLQPVVVINNPVSKFEADMTRRVRELTTDQFGKASVIIRGLDEQRNTLPGETFQQAMYRAAMVMRAPIVASAVNFPTEFDAPGEAPLPLKIQEFVSRYDLADFASELRIAAVYPDFKVFSDERLVGHGSAILNKVEHQHIPRLMQYDALGAPTKYAARIFDMASRHARAAGFSDAYPLMAEGKPNVVAVDPAKGRALNHEMAPEYYETQALQVGNLYNVEHTFEQQLETAGLTLGRTLPDGHSSDYTLAT